MGQTPFYHKLQALNEKISVFKDQFYQKQPRKELNYDNVLKGRKLNFKTFKSIYGHSDEPGTRTVKLGADTLYVDNKNYTYTLAPPPENLARARLLGQTQSSA